MNPAPFLVPRRSRAFRDSPGEHYENNYVGLGQSLTAIAPRGWQSSNSPRRQLVSKGSSEKTRIATNSMILHEVYLDRWAGGGAPAALWQGHCADFGSIDRLRTEFTPWARRKAGGSDGGSYSIRPTRQRLGNQGAGPHDDVAGGRGSRESICYGTPITWTTVPRRRVMSCIHGASGADTRSTYDRYRRDTEPAAAMIDGLGLGVTRPSHPWAPAFPRSDDAVSPPYPF